MSQGAGTFNRLTVEDADKLKREARSLAAVSPVIVTRTQVDRRRGQLAHGDQRRLDRLPHDPRLGA